MMKYEEPIIIFFAFDNEDVLTSSLTPGTDFGEGAEFPFPAAIGIDGEL